MNHSSSVEGKKKLSSQTFSSSSDASSGGKNSLTSQDRKIPPAERPTHVVYPIWLYDFIWPLALAQMAISIALLVAGTTCSAAEICTLSVGVWAGIVATLASAFGVSAVRNPEIQGLLIGYYCTALIAGVMSIFVIYDSGLDIVLAVLKIEKQRDKLDDKTDVSYDATALGLNLILAALAFAFVASCLASVWRICVKLKDPCCQNCDLDFPGSIIYMPVVHSQKKGHVRRRSQ